MTVESQKQTMIASALGFLILATHGHHFASLLNLPPATWAVFFAAGFYLRHNMMFVFLVTEVVILDMLATSIGGVSAYCLSPAYVFMLPTYAVLWGAGRWFSNQYSFSADRLVTLFGSVLVSSALAEVISSGSFYLLSGHSPSHSIAEFAWLFATYFPQSFQSYGFWVTLIAIAHVTLLLPQMVKRRHD